MEEQEYPKFTSEAELIKLTKWQRALVFAEGNPALATTFCLWFFATSLTLPLNYVPNDIRIILLSIAIIPFTVAGIMMYMTIKQSSLEKNQYYSERNFLRSMGVKKPMKFLREHPLHLAAYDQLCKEMSEAHIGSRGIFRSLYVPAMLVFTGPERHTSGPLIMSIIKDRDITDNDGIAAALEAMEQPSPTLNEGAL